MTCGECGASYAKAGKVRFGCQGASKKGPTHCTNRVTIRQDELDARVLSGLSTHMMRDDVLAIFVKEYEAETRRLEKMAMASQADPKKDLAEVKGKITTIKTAILNGVDAKLFVDELKQLQASHAELIRKIEMAVSREPVPELIHGDLGPVYRQKIGKLTDAFESEALKAEAFERIRDLIDAVVLTPVGEAELSIDLRGAFASMLELCACDGIKNAPEAVASEALQIQLVAGVGFEPTTFRL